jgi:hypothetical protein
MKTSKHLLLAAAFVLLAGLCSGAMAQGKMDPEGLAFRLPPQPILTSVTINAIEITDGKLGYDSQTKQETAFGYSFLGRTTGAFPGSFTMSMNCTPAIPVPGEGSELTGGAWTLPVYTTGITTGNGYAGSLYGTVATGKMGWDKTAANAEVSFVLNVEGGTQSYDGIQGYATFVGTLVFDEKTQETMLKGELVFTFTNKIDVQ